ncbi:MAG: PorP/SprF family type IX secretion system membrane protein [Bacteroidaceae bacterium]|nr:PorP/SprF family type IX secretion system membrane protein [Bacteroidaceae bacterium]
MRTRLYIFVFCMLALASLPSQAQFDVHFTHYWALQGYYNPAVAGASGRMNILGTYSLQMAGYTNAPATMLLTADYALPTEEKRHGVSAGLLSDKIGLFNNQRIFGGYAYRMPLWGGNLAMGVHAGILDQTFDGSKVNAEDTNDPVLPSASVDGTAFDLSAGIIYTSRQFYAGIASMHLTAPTIKLGETNEINIKRSYYFQAGGNIRLNNPLLSVQPSVQFMSDLVSWRADITARGTYTYDEKSYYAGLTYSPFTSVALLLGGEINSVRFGYAYELFTNGVGLIQGSHDLFVGYVMDLDLGKKGKNKHKSVRIL